MKGYGFMPEVSAMEQFLTNIGSFFTTSIQWMSSVLSTVTASAPLTILVLAMPIIGFAFGLFKRIKNS